MEVNAEGSTGLVPLVEVWDIENMSLVETFGTMAGSASSQLVEEPVELKAGEAESSPAAAIAALVRARQDELDTHAEFLPTRRRSSIQSIPMAIPPPDIRAFVVGTEFGGHGTLHRTAMGDSDGLGRATSSKGFMLCGSEDRRIRLWDLSKAERSTILSGPESDTEKPAYK